MSQCGHTSSVDVSCSANEMSALSMLRHANARAEGERGRSGADRVASPKEERRGEERCSKGQVMNVFPVVGKVGRNEAKRARLVVVGVQDAKVAQEGEGGRWRRTNTSAKKATKPAMATSPSARREAAH